MREQPGVLIVDDQVGDVFWLIDLVDSKGYAVTLATNEEEGRERLEAVSRGDEHYRLAIIDVMMAVADILNIAQLDEKFFEDSRNAGIRLCSYARKDLGLTPRALPIACLTVREDDEVRAAMGELEIPLFNRAPHEASDSIRSYLEKHLPTQVEEK